MLLAVLPLYDSKVMKRVFAHVSFEFRWYQVRGAASGRMNVNNTYFSETVK